MEKTKNYYYTRFSPEVIMKARSVLEGISHDFKVDKQNTKSPLLLEITKNDETWRHDNEHEFFSDLRKNPASAKYIIDFDGGCRMYIFIDHYYLSVSVRAPCRSSIARVFEVYESNVDACRVPPLPVNGPRVFIGHGRSPLWRDLKDHLHEQHGFDVEAYETGARAGHTIRDVLEQMADRASFACLVLTAEDEQADGTFRARENVVHELGLFQGRLGFTNAIALVEEGANELSNIHGINQLRFHRGRIKETFGDVLATLRREFGVR
jgi:predicted nucleotide-binding protein